MNKKNYFDIQMFAEGAAEGSSEGAENTSGLTGDFKADFDRIVLGKESAPVSQNDTAESEEAASGTEADETEEATTDENSESEDPEKEFEELIKGKYREAFQKRTQGIINERFKRSKETSGKLSLAMEALAPLFDRYGIESGDLEGIKNAIRGDAGIFAKKALEKGMDSEEYRDAFNADRDREQQTALEELQRRKTAALETYKDWKRQEVEIKKTYPSFNLEKAFTENELFKSMAEAGTPLMQAYLASYFDEITAGLVAAATRRAAKQAVDSMQGNTRRPQEGGLSSSAGTVTKKDVGSLTGSDIDSILKAVGRGEMITF